VSNIRWVYYPNNKTVNNKLLETINIFEKNEELITSQIDRDKGLESNDVLKILSADLSEIGYEVEIDKKHKIPIPVLYGENGKPEKWFDVDAYESNEGIIIEVEAGRAVCNNQVIKDFFEACMIDEAQYLIIAVRNNYRNSDDFKTVKKWFDSFYTCSNITIPFKGLLIIGY